MKVFPAGPFLYVLIDGRKGILEKLKGIVRTGVELVQLRDKVLSTRQLIELGRRAKKIMAGRALFFINDRFDIALAIGADGVHLGQDDLPVEMAAGIVRKKLFIGLSTHSLKEVKISNNQPVDYISFGPIFETKTKLDALSPRGLGALKKAAGCSSHPVVAIGGINKENAACLLDTGVAGLAISTGILEANDPSKTILEIRKLL